MKTNTSWKFPLSPTAVITCLLLGLSGAAVSCNATRWSGDAGADGDVPADEVPAGCGDGVRVSGEECDGADLGGQTCTGLGWSGGSLGCTAACTFETAGCSTCGNEAIEAGEQCEGSDLRGRTCEDLGYDGGTLACGPDCLFDSGECSGSGFCGNGIRDAAGGEECDGIDFDGRTCAGLGFDGGAIGCDGECALDTSACTDCGNGTAEAGETCDGSDLQGQTCEGLGHDGGELACTAACVLDTAACRTCGNGTAEPGEECDGSDLGGEDCAGVGYVGGTLACTVACTFDVSTCDSCGNGSREAGEECDGFDLGGQTCEGLGFSGGTLVCAGSCIFDESLCEECGNGVAGDGEGCDGADLRSQTCVGFGYSGGSLGCTPECQYDLGECEECGNGTVGDGEECDGADLGGQTCEGLDFSGGTLACTGGCELDTGGCEACGNGTAGDGEECDGSDFGASDCTTFGFAGGALACTGSCTIETSACNHCGDGGIDAGEECDGSDLGGGTCIGLGYRAGALACAAACAYDVAGCEWCGNGRLETGEDCDGADLGGQTCEGLGFDGGALGCTITCTQDTGTCRDCGNSIVEPGEPCDDGNSVDWDGCNSCTIAEFRVNTYTTGDQGGPDVAMNDDGDVIVVWDSYGQDGDSYGVHAARYGASGAAVGSEFRVNTYTTSHQYVASVAMDPTGNFVVVWTSYGQDGDSNGIYAQRYDAAGAATGAEFRVNQNTAYSQGGADVAMDQYGDFTVVWSSYMGSLLDYTTIYRKVYRNTGSVYSSDARVDTSGTETQGIPCVGMAGESSSQYVVAWREGDTDDDIYRSVGSTKYLVNTGTADGDGPAISMPVLGFHVIVWYADPGYLLLPDAIYGRRYCASGCTSTNLVISAEDSYRDSYPCVAASADQSFVVVWQIESLDGGGIGVYGQRFDSAGTKVGSMFRINRYTAGDQRSPSVARAADGRFVVVWQSASQDGGGTGVYAQRFDASGNAIGLMPW